MRVYRHVHTYVCVLHNMEESCVHWLRSKSSTSVAQQLRAHRVRSAQQRTGQALSTHLFLSLFRALGAIFYLWVWLWLNAQQHSVTVRPRLNPQPYSVLAPLHQVPLWRYMSFNRQGHSAKETLCPSQALVSRDSLSQALSSFLFEWTTFIYNLKSLLYNPDSKKVRLLCKM